MKEGWEYRKLGEVGTFVRCNGILKSDFVDNGYPCIHYGQIHTKFGIATYEHLSEIQKALYDKSRIANPGDIVLAITSENVEGSCKCTAWLGDYDVAVGAHAAIFKHKQNSKYLSYCFRSKSFGIQKAKYARGFKVTEIKPSEVALIEIPVPPIEEQQRIVSELDLLSGIIEKQKVQLKELDTLARSIFYDMFGEKVNDYEHKKLIELFKFIDYRGKTPTKIESGIPLVTARNVRKGYMDYTVKEYISETEYKTRLSRGVSKKGDILFTTEAPMGYAAIADLDVFSGGQRLITFQKKEDGIIDNIYALYFILSDSFQCELENQSTGATVKGIKGTKLENFLIPLPPLALQQQFARKIELIESQKQSISKSIAETQKLFDYTMDKYFG